MFRRSIVNKVISTSPGYMNSAGYNTTVSRTAMPYFAGMCTVGALVFFGPLKMLEVTRPTIAKAAVAEPASDDATPLAAASKVETADDTPSSSDDTTATPSADDSSVTDATTPIEQPTSADLNGNNKGQENPTLTAESAAPEQEFAPEAKGPKVGATGSMDGEGVAPTVVLAEVKTVKTSEVVVDKKKLAAEKLALKQKLSEPGSLGLLEVSQGKAGNANPGDNMHIAESMTTHPVHTKGAAWPAKA